MDTSKITIGVIGLGMMGSSIAVSLLLSGHPIIAIAPVKGEKEKANLHIRKLFRYCDESGLLSKSIPAYLSSLHITEDFYELKSCELIIECVVENREIKRQVYERVEKIVSRDTIIATNTSAIPISILQQDLMFPERFIGIHWAEPAYGTRFMEIVNGSNSLPLYANWVYELAHEWDKEPTLLKKDIRGFITNRLMYAAFREAFFLEKCGIATFEDVDKAMRYDAGSWMTLMGIFERMDYIGLEDFKVIFEAVFPDLHNGDEVPEIMEYLVNKEARGTQGGLGIYQYTEEEAESWEEAFAEFNKDIYQLATDFLEERNYPENKFLERNK